MNTEKARIRPEKAGKSRRLKNGFGGGGDAARGSGPGGFACYPATGAAGGLSRPGGGEAACIVKE